MKPKDEEIPEDGHVLVPAPAATSGAVVPYDGDNPWSDEADEMVGEKIPFVKISYPSSKDAPQGIPNGVYFNNITGDVFSSAKVVLLYMVKPKQANFPRPFRLDNRPICSSSNGWNPDGGTDPLPGPCRARKGKDVVVEMCPALRFGPRNAEGKSTKPTCRSNISMLLWIIEATAPNGETYAVNSPVVMTTHSKANGEVQKLKGRIKGLKLRMPPETFGGFPANLVIPLRLSLQEEMGDGGKYWMQTWSVYEKERIDLGLAKELAAVTQDLIPRISAMSIEELTQVETMDEGDGTPF